MDYVVVKFSRNWADEFDVYGFRVLEKSVWEKEREMISVLPHIEYYFGTNEGWEYEDPREFLENYSVTEISHDDASIMLKVFGNSYGICPSYNDLSMYHYNEEEVKYEDEFSGTE